MSTAPEAAAATPPRTYQIRTYGCQMNVHDSERLAGLLEQAGYRRSALDTQPDIVVFNTWQCVRTPTTDSMEASVTCFRPRRRTPTCRLR